MPENIESAIKDLISCLQLAKIYPLSHPQVKESLGRAYEGIARMLREKDELVVGIVGDELAFQKEIFFDLSRMVEPLIRSLKDKGVEKLVFRRGVLKEELAEFLVFLISPSEKTGRDAQKYLSLKGIRNISAGKLTASGQEEAAASEDKPNRYNEFLNKITSPLDAALAGEDFDYLDLRYTFTSLMEGLEGKYPEIIKLSIFKKHDASTFVHLLDSAVLSMFFAYKIGFAKSDVMDIGIAALFHDIGKIYISRKIIDKPDKLSEEEFAFLRSHSALGAQLLLKYVKHLGILPAVVAFEHHLRYDLQGYPKLAFPRKPHAASLIVSLCDVYDALNKRRSYKKSYPPELVYNLMLVEKGKLFDPGLMEDFFKVIGVWPIGAIVRLSDKTIAVVREVNSDAIFSPRVEVVFPEGGRAYLDLRETGGRVKIEQALDPLEEGKAYAHLV